VKYRTHSSFRRDLKKAVRRGKDAGKLWQLVRRIAAGQPLAPRHRPHPLRGGRGFMECHIEPDWLLIWRQEADVLVLVRTGSHSDLFR